MLYASASSESVDSAAIIAEDTDITGKTTLRYLHHKKDVQQIYYPKIFIYGDMIGDHLLFLYAFSGLNTTFAA